MTTPAQGNVIPDHAFYACDNGKFGKGWPGTDAWWDWLQRTVTRYGPDCACGHSHPTSPSTPPPHSPSRSRGSTGSGRSASRQRSPRKTAPSTGLIPWDDTNVLFLAGPADGKPGPRPNGYPAKHISAASRPHGQSQHPRTAHHRRMVRRATADGTYFGIGARREPGRLTSWMDRFNRNPSLMGGT